MLDNFNMSIGFTGLIEPDEDIEPYLKMNIDQMGSYSPEACAEISTCIMQHCIFVQRVYNRAQSKHCMFQSDIYRMIGEEWDNYPKVFGSPEIKIAMIAKENEPLKTMIKLKNRAFCAMKELEHTADHFCNYARSWEQMGRSRKNQSTGY